MVVCHTISHLIARMNQPVFMVRISHTRATCRVWCWGTEWMFEVMLEICVSQCTSACQCSRRSSPEQSADLSCIETSWQACRLLCVIAKVPISPCRGNSPREHRYTSTQETRLSLYTACGSHRAERPATLFKVLQGCFKASESRCFHAASIGCGACLKVMIIGSYKGRERLVVLLFDDAALFLKDTFICWCQYSSYSLTTNWVLQHCVCIFVPF